MPSPITIVGQGLAGTMLGWELERNGVDFSIVDGRGSDGPAGVAASSVAAGIVNPITGQRIVKSWRVDELLPLARETFARLEEAWAVKVWRNLRVRREWRDEREAGIFAAKSERGELQPFGGKRDEHGCFIEGAAYVDVPKLLAVARSRWLRSGRLREETVTLNAGVAQAGLVILCTGATMRHEPSLAFVPWSVAKGEILTVAVEGADPTLILNRGHWFLPTSENLGKVGATYVPGRDDASASDEARRELEKSASELLQAPFRVVQHETGLRLTLPDKHPVVGRVPRQSDLGVMGGLGSKGVLLAPWLARQWWNHLSEGVPFDPAVDVRRFWIGA